MVTELEVATITATAGKSLRLPRVAVFKVSLYQEVFCVLFLQAPPSESLRVSYTKTSTAVEEIEELIPERFGLLKLEDPVIVERPVMVFALPSKVRELVPTVRIPVIRALPDTRSAVVPEPTTCKGAWGFVVPIPKFPLT